MSWISTRETIMALSVLSVFFLLGGGTLINLGLTSSMFNTGITLAQLIAIGQAYIFGAFYFKYI